MAGTALWCRLEFVEKYGVQRSTLNFESIVPRMDEPCGPLCISVQSALKLRLTSGTNFFLRYFTSPCDISNWISRITAFFNFMLRPSSNIFFMINNIQTTKKADWSSKVHWLSGSKNAANLKDHSFVLFWVLQQWSKSSTFPPMLKYFSQGRVEVRTIECRLFWANSFCIGWPMEATSNT